MQDLRHDPATEATQVADQQLPNVIRDVTELRRKPLGTANVATTLPAYDAPQA
jgi:hypothetical protein